MFTGPNPLQPFGVCVGELGGSVARRNFRFAEPVSSHEVAGFRFFAGGKTASARFLSVAGRPKFPPSLLAQLLLFGQFGQFSATSAVVPGAEAF